MDEPKQIRAGDTITWRVSDGDHPAPTWTLKYALRNAGSSINITSVASGADHVVTITNSASALYTTGIYQAQKYFEKSDGTRETIGTLTIEILPNLVSAAVYDTRTPARKIVEALEAAIQRRATQEQQEIEIAGRRIQYLTPAELRVEYFKWKQILKNEEAAEKINQGLPGGNKILVRMVSPT